MNKMDQTVRLRDGRALGFSQIGPDNGKPIFYFHGSPGSRLEIGLIEDLPQACARFDVRLMGVDRPGIGLSDFKPGRKFIDFPDDVIELADQLGYEKFAVMSFSAGGPYAMACAWKISARLTNAGIVSSPCPYAVPGAMKGMGSMNWMYFKSAGIHPKLTEIILGQMRNATPNRLPPQESSGMAPVDYNLIFKSGLAEKFIAAAYKEVCRSGMRGLGYEASLYSKPWGFTREAITMKVHLWHGDTDLSAPVHQAQSNIQAIPNNEMHWCPGEGHITTWHKCHAEILHTLAG